MPEKSAGPVFTPFESDFLAYVEMLRECRATQLFLELKSRANSRRKNVTRRFADDLDDRKVLHSFRRTFIGRMTELNATLDRFDSTLPLNF